MSNVDVESGLRRLLWYLYTVAEKGDDPRVVRLEGAAEIEAVRDRLVGGCRSSLRSFQSELPHGEQTESAQRTAELVARGIRVQTIGQRERLLGPEAELVRGYLRTVISLGEELRAAERLPLTQLIMVDRSAALMPVLATPPGQAALLVQADDLLRPVEAAFAATWDEAENVDDLVGDDPAGDLDTRSREVLVLLAVGLTDEAIGRELGVTDRTVRRAVADMCRSLRVDCRFQLGLEVARRGWL